MKAPNFVIVLILALVAALLRLSAQSNGGGQDSELLTLPTGEKILRWHGHPGRSYFLQTSNPSNHLSEWFWAPIIESGNDEEISYEVDGTAGKGFFRLRYTDQTPGPGETLETADFDNDDISNWDEVASPFPLTPTDPLDPDTDDDGLGDGWERTFAATVLTSNPTHEGLSASQIDELLSANLNPNEDYTGEGITTGQQHAWTQVQNPHPDDFGPDVGYRISMRSKTFVAEIVRISFEQGEDQVAGSLIWNSDEHTIHISALSDPYASGFDLAEAEVLFDQHGTITPWSTPVKPEFHDGVHGSATSYFKHEDQEENSIESWRCSKSITEVRLVRTGRTLGAVVKDVMEVTKRIDPSNGEATWEVTEILIKQFVIPENRNTSNVIEIENPFFADGFYYIKSLLPTNVGVFERDQIANRIPNPKRPFYYEVSTSSNQENAKLKLYNRLYVATEPESGVVEITINAPSSAYADYQLKAVITDDAGNVVTSAPFDDFGMSNLEFSTTKPMKDAIYYVDLTVESGSNPEILINNFSKVGGPSIQVDSPDSYGAAQDALALVVGAVPSGTAQSFYRTFIHEVASPSGASVEAPETRTIGDEPPTMIAGSSYDQTHWNTEIRSFRLPDGSNASNTVEGFFSNKPGMGLHRICREFMQQNHAAIWNDFSTGGITSKTYVYQIEPGTVLDLYYPGINDPKLAWGRAIFTGGSVTLHLKKDGSKIIAEGLEMQAAFEDYYDFDFTRPTGTFSYWAAMIQVAHEPPIRPRGEIFHTVTEVDFAYNESTGQLANGGPPIEFFNQNGYIENGSFVTTGGGGGGGNE